MDANQRSIRKFVKRYQDTLVIGQHNKVGRLIGWKDGKDDYYWLVRYPNLNKDEVCWETCVGEVIPLKGKINKDSYNRLDSFVKLNTLVGAASYSKKLRKELGYEN